MNIKENEIKHDFSLRTYFIMVFAIAWIGSFLIAGPKFLHGEIFELADIGVLGIPMLLAPVLASIISAFRATGVRGVKDLLYQLKSWRVKRRWLTAPLIFPSLILTVTLILAALVSREFSPTFFSLGILMGLLAGFIEEIGWMGFAYPRMSSNYSPLKNSVYLGVIHGSWHFMADFLVNYAIFGLCWFPYFFGFVLFVVALRVLIVWVYTNTNSLILTQLMHASSTGFLAAILPMGLSVSNMTLFYAIYNIVLWATIVVIILRNRRTGASKGFLGERDLFDERKNQDERQTINK